MKLVNLNDQAYINIERIDEIVPWGEYRTRIYIGGNEGYHDISLPIKKVLNAICGSEEQSVEYEDDESYRRDNNYDIIIGNDNGWERVFGTRSKVLSLLNQLKNNETLTIKRSK